MKVATNVQANATKQQQYDPMPTSHEEFELLPWADPYIAMLVNRHVAESKPARPRNMLPSTNVGVLPHGSLSMLDRFAI